MALMSPTVCRRMVLRRPAWTTWNHQFIYLTSGENALRGIGDVALRCKDYANNTVFAICCKISTNEKAKLLKHEDDVEGLLATGSIWCN